MKNTYPFCCECGVSVLGTGSFRCREHQLKRNRFMTVGSGQRSAGLAVLRAVKEGRLLPARFFVCEDCFGAAKEWDHRDYNKPLEVAAVCHGCNVRRGSAIPKMG
jgi:hypothetical protein